jgi:DNA mismatch endonuclease (patch repair protein)
MTVVAKDKHVSIRMQGNKSKGTKPELLLRKLLTNKGVKGYRICCTGIIGKPDIVFIKKKWRSLYMAAFGILAHYVI